MLVSSQTDRPAIADVLYLHVNKADLTTFDRLAESKGAGTSRGRQDDKTLKNLEARSLALNRTKFVAPMHLQFFP
jgi:hypothetical protein